MTNFAVLATLAAWWSALQWRTNPAVILLQIVGFGALGFLLLVFGGFAYWVDTNGYSNPEQASRVLPVCGGLMLLAEFVLIALKD